MRLRTVAKLGMVLSVILFCMAVSFYGFTKLSLVDKGKEADLFSLVPAEGCMGVLESDNIDYFLNELPQLNYQEELARFQASSLCDYVLTGLVDYTRKTAHGLTNRMNHIVVSFHAPGTPRDQVAYFYAGDENEQALEAMLMKRMPKDLSPKKEKYKGKTIYIYPLINNDFLASYSEGGFLAISYQKRLIEQVIDAKSEKEKALCSEPVFAKAMEKKKSHNFLTFYGRTHAAPLWQDREDCWSEYDLHINSDVLYLTGDTFMPDTCDYLTRVAERLNTLTDVHEDSLVISTHREATALYMDEVNDPLTRTLFDECVANLSRESAFMLVADMHKVEQDPDRFAPYLPDFLLNNATLFRPFILSVQFSLTADKLSHIFVLTYKE